MPAAVRPARPSDAAAIAGLFAQLGYPRTAAEVAAGIDDDDQWCLVAEDDGHVVGVAVVVVRRQLHQGALVGSLDSLVVDETCRGGGVGRRLVDAAIALVAELGARRLEVHSNFRRPDAHRFYFQPGSPRRASSSSSP